MARHGDHGTFTRLAIDWPGKISYRVTREGDRIAVTFTAPANIDLGPAREDLPKELVQIASVNDGVARIYLTLAPGAKLRDFRLGRTVVLDIMRPVKQTAAAPALKLPGKEQAAKEQTANKQQAGTKQQPSAASTLPAAPEPAPAKPAPQTIAEPPAAEPPAPEPKAEPAPQFALQSLPAMPEAEPAPPPSETPPTGEPAPTDAAVDAPPPMPAIEQAAVPPRAPVDVQIKVAVVDKDTKIMFAWPEAVAAAAFRHNGALWLAFDLPSNDIGALLEDARVAKLGTVEQARHPRRHHHPHRRDIAAGRHDDRDGQDLDRRHYAGRKGCAGQNNRTAPGDIGRRRIQPAAAHQRPWPRRERDGSGRRQALCGAGPPRRSWHRGAGGLARVSAPAQLSGRGDR